MMDLKSLEYHKEVDEILKKKNVYIIYDDPVRETTEEEKQKVINFYENLKNEGIFRS